MELAKYKLYNCNHIDTIIAYLSFFTYTFAQSINRVVHNTTRNMAVQDAAHEIVLYDLASTKNVCFSPVVWRIRMMLNYKKIPYKTVFLEMPDIEPTLKEL